MDTTTELTIHVYGTPRPQGSKRAIPIKKHGHYTGKTALIEMSKALPDWRTNVTQAARQAAHNTKWATPPRGTPIKLTITYYMPRPNNHYRTGKNSHLLRNTAPTFHTTRPDSDKLDRAIGDALTEARIYTDDSQIAIRTSTKLYTDTHATGATIVVQPLN